MINTYKIKLNKIFIVGSLLLILIISGCVTSKNKYSIQNTDWRQDPAVPLDAPGPVGDSGVLDVPAGY